MAKSTTMFVCGNCGQESIRWQGQCSQCREWNSLAEIKIAKSEGRGRGAGFRGEPASGAKREAARTVPLREISSARDKRIAVHPEEISVMLGGGLVAGSVVLLGGEPGVGKSTLLTGLALDWVRNGVRVIYVAGEESPAQIRMRGERMGFDPAKEEGFQILDEVELERIIDALDADRDQHPEPCVILADSVQTLHSKNVDAFPGSVSQVRYCGGVLADYARRSGCPVFLVGHVTKSGDLAGPKILEHMVDTVLAFEGTGGGVIRMVRAVKNRFGATGELAVMEMTSQGLKPVDEAAALFLSGR